MKTLKKLIKKKQEGINNTAKKNWGGTDGLARTQTLPYFPFRSFRKHRRARESIFLFPHPYPLALAVNKSHTVFIFYHARSTDWRENRGSVNRLRMENVKRLKRIAIVVSEKLLAQQFFRVDFLLFSTFDMMLGWHICLRWSCDFLIHK